MQQSTQHAPRATHSILAALIILLFALSACTSTITIGWVGPLSGDFVNSGRGAKAAVQLAVEEINENGGINGQQLKVIYKDGACDRDTAKQAAEELIKDGVPVIIGGACSSETLGIADAAKGTGTVVIAYASSSPAITKAGPNVFRTYPSDTNQGFYAAKLTKDAGVQRVAVLACENEWCTGLSKVYTQEAQAMGVDIVANEQFTPTNLAEQLQKLHDEHPDLDGIYFISYENHAVEGLKTIKNMSWDVKVFGADTWDSDLIPREAGDAAEGRKFTYVYAPMSDAFKQALQARGASPAVGSAQAYDAVKIIAQVMNNGATTPAEIADALHTMQPYRGESGTVSFDENGDLRDAVYAIGYFSGGRVIKPR